MHGYQTCFRPFVPRSLTVQEMNIITQSAMIIQRVTFVRHVCIHQHVPRAFSLHQQHYTRAAPRCIDATLCSERVSGVHRWKEGVLLLERLQSKKAPLHSNCTILERCCMVSALRIPYVRRCKAHALVALNNQRKLGDMFCNVCRSQATEWAAAINHVGVSSCRA